MLEILNVFQRRSKEELIARRMFAILIVFQRRNSLPAECWNFWTFFKEGTHCPPTIGNVDRFSKKELSCTEVVPRVNPKISNASSQIISVTIRYPRIPSDSLRFYQMLSDAIGYYQILLDSTSRSQRSVCSLRRVSRCLECRRHRVYQVISDLWDSIWSGLMHHNTSHMTWINFVRFCPAKFERGVPPRGVTRRQIERGGVPPPRFFLDGRMGGSHIAVTGVIYIHRCIDVYAIYATTRYV